MMRKLKDLLLYFYFKYHRILYLFKYKIPILNVDIEKERLVNFVDWVGPIKSAAIVGKGASVLETNPKELIQGCNFKCLMNTIDIDFLKSHIGKDFDAQMTSHIGRVDSLMPVLSKELITKYGINLLICNSTRSYKSGSIVKDYWDYFNNRVPFISFIPEDSDLTFEGEAKLYGGHGLGITANLLRMLYEIKSLEKIVFVGIDAFHFGYAYRETSSLNEKVYYGINAASLNPLETHGKPFLKFLFFTLREINKVRYLEVWFPLILKEYIDFPDEPYYKYYD